MKISLIGTRGVPAAYGGFETAVEEIGGRLADRGHHVVVYCRRTPGPKLRSHRGMRLVHLPTVRFKSAETLVHTFLSALHALVHSPADVSFVFNAANAPFVPLIRRRKVGVAVHVDGLEWQRGKWGRVGKSYYLAAERLAVKVSDALIADAQGISDYYREKFGAETVLLSYGTQVIKELPAAKIQELGLHSKGFHLVVARFEPENHVDVIVEGFIASNATLPLVVVGSAPYSGSFTERINTAAASDTRVRILGGVFDQGLLDELYFHALDYIHGHSVGGTNPSLLRAMGAGTAVIAWDVNFNRDVLGDSVPATFFRDAASAARAVEAAESSPSTQLARGRAFRERAADIYNWEAVATGYENLAIKLAAPVRRHGQHEVGGD